MGSEPGALREVIVLFTKLGVIGFGGPAAHIALMREEVVRRRRWISDERFLDLLGMTNLIPGPNSTEMAIHLGYLRAGWPGLVAGGVCFIVPAMVSVLAFAWAYVRYGSRPEVAWLLYGVKPVIIAVVLQAVWSLARAAVKGPLAAAVGIGVVALYVLGVNEIALLFGGGIAYMLLREGQRRWVAAAGPIALALGAPAPSLAQAAVGAATANLATLFLTFLKIGSVLYGSGYVLLAFLRNDFVVRLGWLTEAQLIDAVAVGQFTPGPVFTTATFIGYVLASWPGAVLATVGIFLPSFAFVALSHPLIPKIRGRAVTAALLDGVNVAALGLMLAVAWELGRAAIVDALTAGLGVAAAVLLVRYRVNSAWLVLGGGAVGIAYRLLAG
jgi:chromate transporter